MTKTFLVCQYKMTSENVTTFQKTGQWDDYTTGCPVEHPFFK